MRSPRLPFLIDGIALPSDYRGPAFVAGRPVWWTGRIAIGLRYAPAPQRAMSASHAALQTALLPMAAERRFA